MDCGADSATYIGLILYLLMGQNYRKDAIFKNKRIVDVEVRKN